MKHIKKILLSTLSGCLAALAAIIAEFLFMFNDDGIIEIHPGPVVLFIFQAVFFSVIILLISLEYSAVAAASSTLLKADFIIQCSFVVMYFTFIIVSPVLLYLLALLSVIMLIANTAIWLRKKELTYMMSIGVFIMIAFLSVLLSTTTYLTVN